MNIKTLGTLIATLRKANNITQIELANLLNMTNKSVSRWERDETCPDITTLPLLASIFNVTVDELLKGELNRVVDTTSSELEVVNRKKLMDLHTRNINNIFKIEDDKTRIDAFYSSFDEDSRLNYSNAAKVEFITTVNYIEKYLKHGMKILEVGAGAGEYSRYFACNGYDVKAVDLSDNNIEKFKRKIDDTMTIEIFNQDARNLEIFEDEQFDIVLVLGPLYHLEEVEDANKCIEEAKRVCKNDGYIFFAFISNDMVILTEFCNDINYLKTGDYNKETFVLDNIPFVFHSVEKAENLLYEAEIDIVHAVGSDGVSEMIRDRINQLDEENYQQYLRYHLYCAEKREMLGRSSHLLYVGQKRK